MICRKISSCFCKISELRLCEFLPEADFLLYTACPPFLMPLLLHVISVVCFTGKEDIPAFHQSHVSIRRMIPFHSAFPPVQNQTLFCSEQKIAFFEVYKNALKYFFHPENLHFLQKSFRFAQKKLGVLLNQTCLLIFQGKKGLPISCKSKIWPVFSQQIRNLRRL